MPCRRPTWSSPHNTFVGNSVRGWAIVAMFCHETLPSVMNYNEWTTAATSTGDRGFCLDRTSETGQSEYKDYSDLSPGSGHIYGDYELQSVYQDKVQLIQPGEYDQYLDGNGVQPGYDKEIGNTPVSEILNGPGGAPRVFRGYAVGNLPDNGNSGYGVAGSGTVHVVPHGTGTQTLAATAPRRSRPIRVSRSPRAARTRSSRPAACLPSP